MNLIEHQVAWSSVSDKPSDYRIVFPFSVNLFAGQSSITGSTTIQYDLSGDWCITAISIDGYTPPLEKLSIAFQFVASRVERQCRGRIETAIDDVLWAVR